MDSTSSLADSKVDARSECRLVVLTGGPGAGKTAILEHARHALGPRIAILPEAAGILFGGGFWRRGSTSGRKAAQRAIFHIQREQERMLREEKDAPFILCDRGSLDGLAYWPDAPATFWGELSTQREVEFARYYAVIHLRTPGAGHGYNHENPLRIEDADGAHAIDERILDAWEGHPRRYVIASSEDFMAKLETTMSLIEHLVATE